MQRDEQRFSEPDADPQPQPPMRGYEVPRQQTVAPGPPPSVVTARRIPADAPFVLRPRRGLLVIGVLQFMLPLGLPLVVPVLVMVLGAEPSTFLEIWVVLSGLVWIVLYYFVWYSTASGGPTLACDAEGVWVRARKWPVRAVWLPWSAVGQVYVWRSRLGRMLCLLPRDPQVGTYLATLAQRDVRTQQRQFGAPLTASVTYGDRDEHEIRTGVERLTAGRCTVR